VVQTDLETLSTHSLSCVFLPDDMRPLHDPCGKIAAFRTTQTRKWIYLLAAASLSGIYVLHLSAPDDWREVAMEKVRNAQGPFWPGQRPQTIWDERAQRVKDAFVGAYGHYRKYAFGADELSPLSNKPKSKYA
jgi:hypothetical protein